MSEITLIRRTNEPTTSLQTTMLRGGGDSKFPQVSILYLVLANYLQLTTRCKIAFHKNGRNGGSHWGAPSTDISLVGATDMSLLACLLGHGFLIALVTWKSEFLLVMRDNLPQLCFLFLHYPSPSPPSPTYRYKITWQNVRTASN